MPFKQLKNNAVWEDPDPARGVDGFVSKLLDFESKEMVIPPSVESKLNSFVNFTMQGAQRLSTSNGNRASSLDTIINKGIKAVDIILPVYGNLHVVKPCIEAIFERTSWPYHLTIINDESPDEATVLYLSQVQKNDNVKVIHNKKNN